MYTRFQRFVATILLCSIFLQSCGNPNWKMAEEDSPSASGETSEPSKAKKRAPANLLQVQDGAVRDFDGAPQGKGATKALAIRPRGPASASSAALLGAASYVQPTAPSRAAHRDGRLSTSPLTPVRSPGVPATSQRFYSNSPSQSPGPLTARKNPAKPRHVVLGKASMALRQAVPRVHARTIAPVVAARPTAPPIKTLQPTPQAIIPTHKEKAVVLKSAAAPVASSGTLVGPFPVASAGKEVVFSQVEGCWTAVVRETWGTFTREESLPVLCKGDVLAALHNLQGKAAIHTKRHIHILETHQPPWSPRVVYVGTLGVRGGGNSSSSSRCTYPGWIYGGNNSDGEPDGEVRSGGHRFYRSNTNHWCVEIIPGVLGSITRADSSLTLSANDIRAIGSWHHHDCHVGWGDCYVPHTSCSTIIAQRERRQEDRRRRREEQRRRQEEAHQEEARRQEEERRIAKEAEDRAKQIYSARCKIQEELIRAEERKQRLDATHRREEERRQQEEARRREEERIRQEEAQRQEKERRREEERRQQEEARRQEEERIRQEEARREEEEQVLVEQTMQNASEATLTHDVALEQGQEDRLCNHLEAIHVQSTLDQEVTQVQGVSSLSSGTPED